MTLEKEAISKRLREFGIQKFGSIKAFAEALDTAPSSLQSTYLNGRSLPGAPMLSKLMDYGLNIRWLFYGDDEMEESNRLIEMQNIIAELKEENTRLKDKLNKMKSFLE